MSEERISIVALMSIPRYGPNAAWNCISESLAKVGGGIPIKRATGAFWHQHLQTLMEHWANVAEWLLIIDHDSLFSARQLDTLLRQFGADRYIDFNGNETSGIDALCALQPKRGPDNVPLMTVNDEDGRPVREMTVTATPRQAHTAHFGLTLIRSEALRAVPRPWFKGVPNDEGSYGEGRTDADIYFWRNWEKHKRSLCVSPGVSIGHLEELVLVLEPEMNVKHYTVMQWIEKYDKRPEADTRKVSEAQ